MIEKQKNGNSIPFKKFKKLFYSDKRLTFTEGSGETLKSFKNKLKTEKDEKKILDYLKEDIISESGKKHSGRLFFQKNYMNSFIYFLISFFILFNLFYYIDLCFGYKINLILGAFLFILIVIFLTIIEQLIINKYTFNENEKIKYNLKKEEDIEKYIETYKNKMKLFYNKFEKKKLIPFILILFIINILFTLYLSLNSQNLKLRKYGLERSQITKIQNIKNKSVKRGIMNYLDKKFNNDNKGIVIKNEEIKNKILINFEKICSYNKENLTYQEYKKQIENGLIKNKDLFNNYKEDCIEDYVTRTLSEGENGDNILKGTNGIKILNEIDILLEQDIKKSIDNIIFNL